MGSMGLRPVSRRAGIRTGRRPMLPAQIRCGDSESLHYYNGDCTGNGFVNFGDINCFVALLSQ